MTCQITGCNETATQTRLIDPYRSWAGSLRLCDEDAAQWDVENE